MRYIRPPSRDLSFDRHIECRESPIPPPRSLRPSLHGRKRKQRGTYAAGKPRQRCNYRDENARLHLFMFKTLRATDIRPGLPPNYTASTIRDLDERPDFGPLPTTGFVLDTGRGGVWVSVVRRELGCRSAHACKDRISWGQKCSSHRSTSRGWQEVTI